MANYTKLNLRGEIEDQAPKFGMTEMEFRSARVPLEMQNAGLSFLRVAPNYRVPFGHHHKTQEEVYILVNGSARLKLDDDVIEMRPEGAEIIAFGAPNVGSGDGPMTQEWWTD